MSGESRKKHYTFRDYISIRDENYILVIESIARVIAAIQPDMRRLLIPDEIRNGVRIAETPAE